MIFQSINLNDGYSDWKAQKELSNLIYNEYLEQKNNGKKYNIIRLPSINYYQDLEEMILTEFNDNADIVPLFINYHSKKMILYDFNELIRDKPIGYNSCWICP